MNKTLYGFFIAISLCLPACRPNIGLITVELEGVAQGTTYHITYLEKTGKSFQAETDSLFQAIDKSLSVYDSGSLISRINNNDTLATADKFFTDVFKRAAEISEFTKGAFDITVAPVYEAWMNGLMTGDEGLDSTLISGIKEITGYTRIALVNGKVKKEMNAMSITMDGIAQGYTVDRIAAFLEEKNIRDYIVEVGGELRAKGKNSRGEPWVAGIEKPLPEKTSSRILQAEVALENRALSTSGNYRHFIIYRGKRYGHIIDPRTAFPVQNNLMSVSVFAPDCMTADAYATAMMVLGIENSKKILAADTSLDAYFIFSNDGINFSTWASPRLEKILKENK